MRKWLVISIVVMLMIAALPARAQQTGGQRLPLPGADAFERAQAALQAGDFEDAVLQASLFVLVNPTYSRGYYLRGVAYAQLGDAERALDDLDRALRYPAPDAAFTASLYNIRSIIHAQMGETAAALDDLSAAIEATPDDAALYGARATLYGAQGELDKALADYNRALELDATATAAYTGRALVYLRQDKLAAALEDYNHALEQNPDDVESLARRASIYLRQEDFELALADASHAIDLQPDAPALYLTRGAAYNGLGQHAAAAADFHEWLERIGQQTATYQGKLNPGESVVAPLAAGKVYRFPFEAQAGQTLRLSATAREGAATDPLIVLLDAQGNPVAADDDSGGGMNARIDAYAAPESGTYTLLVGHAGGSPDGPVRVLLEVITGVTR
ncbi:MAG: tetratricopeptide repeat protein [Chloroflexi bacterium]|nr:tetratricopeptide repeat protein [Chloroflexota bacterium]